MVVDDCENGSPRAEAVEDLSERLPHGRHFDEFAVGQVVICPSRTITEADIVQFAALSGDHNPLHTDEAFASRTVFRSRIAHGLLIQSIATGLADRTGIFYGTVAALKDMSLSFTHPVRIGDTVHLVLRVLEVDPEPSRRRGWVRFSAQVINQEELVVLDGEWCTVLMRAK